MEQKSTISQEELINPIKGAISYLDKAFLNKDIISEAINEENYQVAWKEMENLISGIETLNELLYHIKKLLDLDYEDLKYEGKSLSIYIEDFNNFLKDDVLGAMENKDYVLVSDLINYELQSYLKEYQKVFIFLFDYVSVMKVS